MGLKEYKAKRNFSKTREPAGAVRASARGGEHPFVIQKHDATRLHYDFRLEMEGVLKSWAVPKGLPMARGDRRLAVEVEDHPLDYADFEGTIPEGNYGAGTVMVWDYGTYQVSGDSPIEALKSGKLHFTLSGKKLKGEWALVRMRPRENETKPQWLLLKSGADLPPLSAAAEHQSAVTKRTFEQIAAKGDRQWQSNRASSKPAHENARSTRMAMPRSRSRATGVAAKSLRAPRAGNSGAAPELNAARLPTAEAQFIEPMKALLVDDLPRGPGWIYEIKFDGVRAIAVKRGAEIQLVSRSAKPLTSKYSTVAAALKNVRARQAVLDGEVVALDSSGKPSFQLLQACNMPGEKKPPLFYYVFDLLNLDGKDLTGLPLVKRKAMAEALVAGVSPMVRFSAAIDGNSEKITKEMQARGLEGLLAKKSDSKYASGRRNGSWVKFKWTNEQEFVIGGFTEPQGSREHFGAILVGFYEKGELRFAGKVGTGFNHKQLGSLHQQFKKIIQPECPFSNLPEKKTGRWSGGLTASEMRRCTWLRPELVCQVHFAEWTRDHHLRQPSFVGLREDKKPREVVREKSA
jgi:bifunctional non-homologous end joining protein LigD